MGRVPNRALALAALLAGSFAASARAQIPTERTLVLTQTSGAVRAQVLAVSPAGVVATFGRFPSDTLTPLAIALDPVDRQPLVAVELSSGSSRVLRLVPGPGFTFASELPLADLPGPCAQLEVIGDTIVAVVGGASGGIFRLPRRGGAATQTFALPFAAAAHVFASSSVAIVAWSGATTPPSAPGLVHVDTETGAIVLGPTSFTNRIGATPTGLFDLPTALSRQVVAFADGTYWLHTFGLGNPTQVTMSPQPPAGGAAALHQDQYGFSALAVGGAALPALYRADSSGTVTILAQPLAGAPVDLAVPAAPSPAIVEFGVGCGSPPLQLVNGVRGPPQIGNSAFEVRALGSVAFQPTVFVFGFDDILGGSLPATVLGCLLHVSPDLVDVAAANAGGLAIRALPIPANPTLAGVIAYGQWAQLRPSGTIMSSAFALQLGL